MDISREINRSSTEESWAVGKRMRGGCGMRAEEVGSLGTEQSQKGHVACFQIQCQQVGKDDDKMVKKKLSCAPDMGMKGWNPWQAVRASRESLRPIAICKHRT